MHPIRTLVILVIFILINACASTGNRYVPVEDQSTTVEQQHEDQIEAGVEKLERADITSQTLPDASDSRQAAASPAVIALLESAERDLQAGKSEYAVASIERALNLEPKNAILWSRLATIRLAQQDWQQAYVLANKSNSLAQGNTALQRQNWQIIARAKTGQSDVAGAAEARKKLEDLR